MAGDTPTPIGDPLLERLERLAARQGRTPPARPLPPPTLGSVWPATMPPYATPLGPPAAAPIRTASQPTVRTRRRHPARGARIGALVASCATTGGLAYFFAGTDASQASSAIPGLAAPITTTATTTATTVAPATTAPATTAGTATTAVPATTAAPTTTATATDAVVAFDGATVNTKYGPVQVQAQVQNGTLVAVAVVQYPDGDGKSVRINQRALPELQSEALSAQSASVDTISGATYTSNAYVKSLQSAIDEAKAAGALTA